jgi:DNA-binding MarR family transcriptional regulator
MDNSKEQLVVRFAEALQGFLAQSRSRSLQEWTETELTMPQVRTLILLGHGPKRMSDLASYLGSGMSSATSMIDRLVSKGLVERIEDESDRRVVTCQLTGPGQEIAERFLRLSLSRMESTADILTLDELEVIVPALELLRDAITRRRDRLE